MLSSPMFPRRIFLTLVCILLSALSVSARVLRVDITSRETVLGGKSFGDSGPYERIVGRIYFTLPIANPHNQAIVDLSNAQNLRNGAVEVSADFTAVRPKDPGKGNHSMLLEVPNRGNARFLALVDGGDEDLATDAGDAWLLRKGFTVVSIGWQWDAANPDALRLYTPIAKQDGKTITGLLRGDIMPSHPMEEIRLGHLIQGSMGGTEYPVSSMDDPRNVLTVRNTRDERRTLIPRSDWQFAHMVDGKLTPADRFIHLNGGFQAGKIYEYVYVVADPVIAGAGFAAIRDVASWAKHDPTSVVPAERVYGQGISQNGRYLRDFLYQGFNADEEGRIALDGVLAHVAGAGRGSFNYRFAQPSRDAQPTSSISFPTDLFPFTDQPETDPLTHETAGLLDRATRDRVLPRIFFSNTSYEYWGRAAALIHITADGKHDAPIANKVRIYHFTGLQHFPGPFPPAQGTGELFGQQPESALPIRFFWRAMVANMDAWVHGGVLPPPSNYPRLADGNLVPLNRYVLPAIPGLHLPHDASEANRLDFGPQWRRGVLSLQPPKVGPSYPVLVPEVDADGNERDGVRLPEIAVPLGTYVGWNLRNPTIGAPTERLAFEASYLAFAKTKEDRRGDPRKSIAERYKDRDDYLAKYAQATDALIKERWLLPEDRESLLHRGAQEWAIATQ